ncbi:MAG TPA: ABC transporter ATP-binding protein [Acidimicrobiales bacterium]|nr:ABC transporter ATP-binding protein [Acidimicrobiales bacterium]
MPVLSWGRRLEISRLVRVLVATNPAMSAWSVAGGLISGALLPGFILATGAVIGAVSAHRSVALPVAVLVGVFLAERIVDPVLEASGQALWRQIDESLDERLILALVGPPGLAQVESPSVRDRLTQAKGYLTDTTPGLGGYYLGRTVALFVQGLGSVVIVAVYKWWLAFALLLGYWAAFRVYRAHWRHVTLVLYGRTDRLRHAYYLRRMALEPEASKETRVFGLAGWLVDGYRHRWLSEMRDIWAARREGWAASAVVVVGLASLEAVAVVTVAVDAAHGRIGVSHAVVLAQAVLGGALLGVYRENHWYISELGRAVERVEEVEADAGAAVSVSEGGAEASGMPRCSIRFEGVRFSYPGSDRPVFDDLDLEVEAGRSLAIVGANGAGKTTLIKLLCRFYDPTGGRVMVDDVDLREIDPASWHRRVAAVFQDYVQFELSAHDNVAYGALHNRSDRAGVVEAAGLAGAGPFVDRLEAGWDTPLSRLFSGGTQLSGGEWQRLALARALFAVRSGAGLLILDEPTAALDARGEAEVYERFLELTRGSTTIVISHRFSTVRRADRIVVIEGGRVVEDGTHDSLLAAGGRYAELYRLQASRFDSEDRTYA